MDDSEILAVVQASGVRRLLATGLLGGIGGLLLYSALVTPPPPVAQILLIGLGALALWMAERVWRATEYRIELTETELRDSGGVRIALVSEIEALDSGFLAFKPSNGFVLRTTRPVTRAWRPGLWWRFGRRVGIGGVTPGAQAKVMADLLAMRLIRRDQESDHTT